jgi:hypothetical protein
MKRSIASLPALLATALLGPAALAGPPPDGVGDPPPDRAYERDLAHRLQRLELLSGLTPVAGPGVLVRLQNSPRIAPRGADRNALLVQERDFSALLNALRAGGAEAIGVGAHNLTLVERVTGSTVTREAPNGAVWVDHLLCRPPLRILAIGDAVRLRTELFRPDGVIRRAGLDVLQMVEVIDVERLALPRARPAEPFRFAETFHGDPAAFTPVPAAPPAAVKPAAPGGAAGAPPEREPDGTPRVAKVIRRPAPGAAATVGAPSVLPGGPPPPGTGAAGSSATPPTPPGSEQSSGGALFGGRGLAKYHLPGCRYGERIDAAQRVTFLSAQDARHTGRKACPICLPPQTAAGPR